MTDALARVLATRWTRQGEWGGTTLSRSLIYAGLQRTLADWTGVREGYERFLHSGDTTYIASGQFERFAAAYRARLEKERSPLRSFTLRFAALQVEVAHFHETLEQNGRHDEKVARYLHLHQSMQPYSYVFGYGEEQIVGQLLERTLHAAGLSEVRTREAIHAATAPLADARASETLASLRREGVDARAIDLAELVREQVQVRTDRRLLWNKVERAMHPSFAFLAQRASLPVRLLLEATPYEVLHALPSAAALEARIGATFFADEGDVVLLRGADHARVQAHLATPAPAATTSLRGQSAYPGVVRGRVRIVLHAEHADELVKGEVLVSDMTTPELTTACSRAIAIVTDRGGILCHAALVAREMEIPCVLGTEDATRILRTGDEVEVDATRGIVRLLAPGGA